MAGAPWFRRYELCNEYGLYVIDEANVETHGFDGTLHNNEVNPTNDPAWCASLSCAIPTSTLRRCSSHRTLNVLMTRGHESDILSDAGQSG